MFKKIFFWGLTAGILSAVASIIYKRIFDFAYTYEGSPDYTRLASNMILVAVNLAAGMIAALGFWGLISASRKNGELIFNLLFSLGSFASIMYPVSAKLPLDIQMPELFPLLVVPMHFFPAITWFTVRPLFAKNILK